MIITKKDIIQKLYDIEERENLKLGREVQRVVRNEIVPMDVITFINKYDKNFLQIYDTYNTIYMSRNKNPLYKNLKKVDLATPEVAVAISSLVTKILISCTKIKDDAEKQLFVTAMGLADINTALTEYATLNDATKLNIVAKQVRDLLNILYEN